jgi:acyl-[acyl-carrier-protein]-phospholipid O-acyltransferase / long-chain-fatty-acid--[acyl-carrier-protein] ligase
MTNPTDASADATMVLQRRLLRACRSAAGRLKVADSLGTRLTGRQLLLRILAARSVLERVLADDEKMVGVLLPPTAGAAVVNAALSLSGRVAVNLNYTATQSILDTCIERAGLRHVISSPVFLKRVKLDVGDRMLDAGALKERLTAFDKVVAAVHATVTPVSLLERILGLHRIRPDDVLTVIFTSGSTGDPKGVVLSVENVGSNVRAIDELLHLSHADVALGVLPFFHSYGYTTTLWTPLTLEPAVVYHTNPLDAQEVGRLAREHHATILMATPTFLRTYVRRTAADDFSTLEAVFGAAEKLTRDVADAFEKRFGVRPWEAYGATELSPLVAANVPPSRHVPGRPVDAREGTVGRPIAGCHARITDRDGGHELPLGQEGLLWISGPNVMQGYLDRPDLTAKVVREGWYCTGDIARLDAEGFITITGRESRFSKIGGEMVPHLSVEESLNEELGAADGELLAVVTAVPDVAKGERLIVFHLPTGRDRQEICRKLSQRGLPNLWIPSPDSFVEIAEIPLLGSGKLDLKRLSVMALERFGSGRAS